LAAEIRREPLNAEQIERHAFSMFHDLAIFPCVLPLEGVFIGSIDMAGQLGRSAPSLTGSTFQPLSKSTNRENDHDVRASNPTCTPKVKRTFP
jgi:hypothetical protein